MKRSAVEDFEFGFPEPELEKITPGKCTLRQAVQFISDYQQKPGEWNAERIAKDLKLKQDDVEDILSHFRMFEIHIPKTDLKTKKILLDPFAGAKQQDFDKLMDGAVKKKVNE
jgi:NADH dehydrogenase [ubiquinone] 1 alpha subcomplex assembly factor 4